MPSPRKAILGVSLLALTVLAGCSRSEVPVDVFEASPGPGWTDTPVPECVSLPDVKLEVILPSENSARIRITGLRPSEPVYTVFSSRAADGRGKSTECCPGETAGADGSYEYSVGLRGQDVDREFTDWQVRVIHARGAACAEFVLPGP